MNLNFNGHVVDDALGRFASPAQINPDFVLLRVILLQPAHKEHTVVLGEDLAQPVHTGAEHVLDSLNQIFRWLLHNGSPLMENGGPDITSLAPAYVHVKIKVNWPDGMGRLISLAIWPGA